ncbi:MAG: T9SS C-terminal target domain-containing protein, partial [Cyclobacteriaceae bacterium]|nr:T9SS C-terminal target domain-containing protein [Cyclobacteriaceae bacterium]
KLWARRQLTFGDLSATSFTIGSFRELSILPVNWLEMQATWKSGTIQISWTTAQEKSNEVFHILRSLEGLDEFEKIGSVYSKGDHEDLQTYHFEYTEKLLHPNVYFQLQQVDLDGKSSFSKVFRLQNWQSESSNHPAIWPNPFVSGRIQVQLPDHWESGQTLLTIYQDNGVAAYSDIYTPENLNQTIDKLRSGLIFLEFVNRGERQVFRLIKK